MHLQIDYSGPKADVLDKLEADSPEGADDATPSQRSAQIFEANLRRAIAHHVEEHAADGQVAVNVQVHARFRSKPPVKVEPTAKTEGGEGGEA